MRLYFQNTARNKEMLFIFSFFRANNNLSRLDLTYQRGMARVDTYLTANQRYKDRLYRSGEDFFFCANDIEMHSHGHCLLPQYTYRVLARSTASSIEPIM